MALLLLHQGLEAGLQLVTSTEVTSCERSGSVWLPNGGAFQSQWVIHCTGTRADVPERSRSPAPARFTSHPQRGQFAILELEPEPGPRTEAKAEMISLPDLIYPVATTRIKGVVLWTPLSGHTIVGPTAEDQADRNECVVTDAAHGVLPACARQRLGHAAGLCGEYAELRPATDHRDFCIGCSAEGWLYVAFICSTGFSVCLAIAQRVCCGMLGLGEVGPGQLPPGFESSPLMDAEG